MTLVILSSCGIDPLLTHTGTHAAWGCTFMYSTYPNACFNTFCMFLIDIQQYYFIDKFVLAIYYSYGKMPSLTCSCFYNTGSNADVIYVQFHSEM